MNVIDAVSKQPLRSFGDDVEAKHGAPVHADTKVFVLRGGQSAKVRIRFRPTAEAAYRQVMNATFLPMDICEIRNISTLCGVHSVAMFCFILFRKFWLPIGLHISCNICPTASGTFQKCYTKYHD